MDMGYYVIDHEPTEVERQRQTGIVKLTSEFSYSAYRSGFDDAAGRLARKGLIHLYGEEPILESSMLLAGDESPAEVRRQLSRWVRNI